MVEITMVAPGNREWNAVGVSVDGSIVAGAPGFSDPMNRLVGLSFEVFRKRTSRGVVQAGMRFCGPHGAGTGPARPPLTILGTS
ncbi:MAG: hypothetical protein RIM96_18710 [Thalassobaculum sp.]|uniref:hypothetical protein n=1 Tax=Thalassobaculum sp. TaxID=2022740 RepID=UPI0032EF3EC7